MKPHSNGVDNENEPISTSTPKKPTKTQQKPGARIKLAFQEISKGMPRHKQQWTFNHIKPLINHIKPPLTT